MTVIDLDTLTDVARLPRVRLFGREMVVLPLTGAAAHRLATLQDAEASPTAMIGPLLELVARSVPALTHEEREQLTVDQLAALLQLSRGQVADVEAMIAAAASRDASPAAGSEGNETAVGPTG